MTLHTPAHRMTTALSMAALTGIGVAVWDTPLRLMEPVIGLDVLVGAEILNEYRGTAFIGDLAQDLSNWANRKLTQKYDFMGLS